MTAHGRRRYALALRVVGSREQTLDAFVAAHFHQRVAVTLDGDTVAIVDLQPEASQFTSTQGVFEVAPSRGFSETTAHDLRNAFGEARDEQLVGLLESATMTRRRSCHRGVGDRERRRPVPVRERLPGPRGAQLGGAGVLRPRDPRASCGSTVPTSPR